VSVTEPSHPTELVSYGDHPSQYIERWRRTGSHRSGVAVLLHGGYWRNQFGCDLMHPMARRLANIGWNVVNVEYRRVGESDDPWPAMADDVESALAEGPADSTGEPIVIIGHSAGGQLALWVASLAGCPELAGIVALAPVADLEQADRLGLSDNAVRELLGDDPTVLARRIRHASPMNLVPLGVRQFVVHGDADVNVPQAISADYVAAAERAGDDVVLHDPAGVDHFDIIDPTTEVWRAVEAQLATWSPDT